MLVFGNPLYIVVRGVNYVGAAKTKRKFKPEENLKPEENINVLR